MSLNLTTNCIAELYLYPHILPLFPKYFDINPIPWKEKDSQRFTQVPLTDSNFELQKPYNEPLANRYTYVDGVHRFLVLSTDVPYEDGSSTDPRTEIRISGYDYSSGIWQFEGFVFVPNGTSGACVMQIHKRDGVEPATTLMLRVFDGELRFYSEEVVETDVYDRWMRLNVIHDADEDKLTIFIDGVQKLEVNGNGPSLFYFKCGVYAQANSSPYMESNWKDIKVYKRD